MKREVGESDTTLYDEATLLRHLNSKAGQSRNTGRRERRGGKRKWEEIKPVEMTYLKDKESDRK